MGESSETQNEPAPGAPSAPGDRVAAARLALAIEAGRMAVWDFDLVGDRITGSPELNRLLGFPPDATPTTDEIRSRYYPGERERLQTIGRDAMARGERFVESEFRYLWPDGSVRWVLLRAEALTDRSGRPVRALGVVMDVTARKLADQALEASETRLRLAQSAAGIGVWEWDVSSGAIDWSPRVYAILGLDPARDPPSRDTWLNVQHPDDRAASRRAIQRALQTGEGFSVEFRVEQAGTSGWRWVRSSGAAVLGPDGRPTRLVGVNVDITDERRREDGLHALAGDLRTLVEAGARERDRIYELSNDLFGVLGFDGYLKTVNPAWARLLGYDDETLVRRPILEIVHPDDRAAASAGMSTLRSGEGLHGFEVRLLRANGGMAWTDWAAVVEGERIYAVGRDVTRDREREEALRQAQKMEAVGQLTGGLAHDFNNLLQAVHGNLELIRLKPGDTDRVSAWASNGLQATERGAKLIAQLLAFSRAQHVEMKSVPVARLVAGLEELLGRTLGPMVRIKIVAGGDDLFATADATQLETALLNLCINARDAMMDGGEVSISTSKRLLARDPDLPPGEYVEIVVADTGIGMPADLVARAFDPFFTTKPVGKGTGLGLSQVYGMARQAGGIARITSRVGQGTSVSLLLRHADRAANGDARAARLDRATDHPGSRATVLVVDDDADVRLFLEGSLSALGYDAVLAESGTAGLSAVERAWPDVMLLDFSMPDLDGAAVAGAVRRRGRDLPIIFATGHSDSRRIEASIGSSELMLRKPFTILELDAMLKQALGRA